MLVKVRLQEPRWRGAIPDVRYHQAARHCPRIMAINKSKKPIGAVVRNRMRVVDNLALGEQAVLRSITRKSATWPEDQVRLFL